MSRTTALKDQFLKNKVCRTFSRIKDINCQHDGTSLARNPLIESAFKYISHQRTVPKSD